jgi:hypothetical protein
VGAPEEEAEAEPGEEGSGAEPAELFPPGPLASVSLSPKRIIVEVEAERSIRARATDGAGRAVTEGLDIQWELSGPVGSLRPDPNGPGRAVVVAGNLPGEGILSVQVREKTSGNEASAAAPVEVVEILPSSAHEGIPEPELVDAPAASWRSRFHEERWQVNSGHPDYKANSARPALKLRYLAMLFAKEVVLRSSQDPRLEDPLEQMVEVAAYADRMLTERPPRGRKGTRKPAG